MFLTCRRQFSSLMSFGFIGFLLCNQLSHSAHWAVNKPDNSISDNSVFTQPHSTHFLPKPDLTPATPVQVKHSSRPGESTSWVTLPLSFEANTGQTASEVRYLSRGSHFDLYLSPSETVFAFKEPTLVRGAKDEFEVLQELSRHEKTRKSKPASYLRMKLVGAATSPEMIGQHQITGTSHVLSGQDTDDWQTNIPRFEQVRYQNAYPGIDLIYYGNQSQLEYDFQVSPQADPSQIKLQFDGADRVSLDNGDLVLQTGRKSIRQQKPVAYVEGPTGRELVACTYKLNEKHQVGFYLGDYDRSRPLVIDPIVLDFGTYLGGAGDDQPNAVAVDSDGNIYIAGSTTSTDFPTQNATQATNNGITDVFVTKIDPKTGTLVFSTYFGGNGEDVPFQLQVDTAGNVFVAGTTSSTNFPTLNAVQNTLGGTFDAFVFKLNADGRLSGSTAFSTYIGGSQDDAAIDFDLDPTGNVYLTGFTASDNFPTVEPFQNAFQGAGDAIIARLNAAGNRLDFSTYFGGSRLDVGFGIQVNEQGQYIVTGDTASRNFPVTSNASQSVFGGGELDGFLAVFAPFVARESLAPRVPPLPSIISYLGGIGRDSLGSVAAMDNIIVTAGRSTSNNLMFTQGAIQTQNMGGNDALFSIINTNGEVMYQTLFGGNGEEQLRDVKVTKMPNGENLISLIGVGTSQSYPIVPTVIGPTPNPGAMHAIGIVATQNGLSNGENKDIAVAQIAGNGDTVPNGVANGPGNQVAIVGSTMSNNLPFNNAPLQAPSLFDGFLASLENQVNQAQTMASIGDATANEADGVANIPITLTSKLDFPATFSVTPEGGTAQPGTDFIPQSFSFSIPAGQTQASIPVRLIDDIISEPTETFSVGITTSQSGVGIGRGRSLISLLDNDAPSVPKVCFEKPIRFLVSEDGGSATVTLNRTGDLSLPSSFSFQTGPSGNVGEAQPGVNFTPTSGTINFPAGSSSQSITIPILDNKEVGSNLFLSFNVQLSNAVNANLCNNQVQIIIGDDEQFEKLDIPTPEVLNVQIEDGFESGNTDSWKVNGSAFATTPRPAPKLVTLLKTVTDHRPPALRQSRIIGFNFYRVPQPPEGFPLPSIEDIVANPNNLGGTSLTGQFSELIFLENGLTGNWVCTVTALFEDGTESEATKRVALSLPVIQGATFEKASISLDANGTYISRSGAVLIVNDQERYPLVLDTASNRFVVSKKTKSSPGGKALKKLVKVNETIRIVIQNADGTRSLFRVIKRTS